MKNFSVTFRFEMDDYKFKNSDEFYNYLQEVFARDRTVLRIVDVEDKDLKYCADCGNRLPSNGFEHR